ncbi:putative transcriptional regulatory protein [Fonsecaea pedrosoi]|nr:putative transcriptional regulatory protein [Fonsecaea pedrosoi]
MDSTASAKRGTRSKTGCATCRTRKLKCDEIRPVCARCSKSRLKCDWDQPVRRARTRVLTVNAPSNRLLAPADASHASPHSTESVIRDETRSSVTSSSSSSPRKALDVQSPLSLVPSALSTAHIPLSNALQLTPQDQQSFVYVQNSVMVLRIGKPFQWSNLSYVYLNIASKYAGVMRIFIAGASMELRSRALLDQFDGTLSSDQYERARRLEHSATSHYHLALKDLSALVDHVSSSQGSDDDVDALFAMWFLILHFGLYDSQSIGASHVHLEGIRSFLKPYLKSRGEHGTATLPLASQQLLYFISYMDVYLAFSSMASGKLWMDLLSEDADSPVSYDGLFYSARSCLPKLWGPQYPVSELLDDLENYRPLHLLHLCQKPKLSILNLAASPDMGRGDKAGRQRLWKELTKLGDEFADVLALADRVVDTGTKRLIWTVYHASLEFYALQVLYSCLDPDDEYPPWLQRVVATVTSIGYKAVKEDPRQLYRLVWPLAIAMIRTRDLVHRDWLKDQLLKAQILLPSFGLPGSVWDGKGLLGQLLLEANHTCHSVATTADQRLLQH